MEGSWPQEETKRNLEAKHTLHSSFCSKENHSEARYGALKFQLENSHKAIFYNKLEDECWVRSELCYLQDHMLCVGAQRAAISDIALSVVAIYDL